MGRINTQFHLFAVEVVAALNEGGAVVINPPRRYPSPPVVRIYSSVRHDDVLRDIIRVLQGSGAPEILDQRTVDTLRGR